MSVIAFQRREARMLGEIERLTEQLQGAVKSLQEVRELLYTRSGTPRRGTLPAILRIDAAIDSIIGGQ